ncbi:MAG: acetylornithine deacetylase [Deltaproteobacteria bacterium]|nr:acetylornithine deacetylase [Deltaproteobacteria bacterium]
MTTRKGDVRSDLERLVAFDSVSSRPMADLAAHVAQGCEDLGFRTELFPDATHPGKATVVASIGPDTGREGLLVSGHLDVVPTEGQPWTSDPFRMVERDGRLYGRGTADMKGFVAATMQALARIDRTALRRALVLVWTHDEEVGCLGSAQVAAELARRRRIVPRSCLIGEPTGFRVLRMHPGHVGVEIEVRGQAAHSSRPDLGRNAIVAAARVIAAIEELGAQLACEHASDLPELDRPFVVLNVGRISGGTAINIVPDRAVIHLGYRQLPGMADDAPFRRLEAHLAVCGAAADWSARILRITPALLTPAGTSLERVLSRYASAPEVGAATFATDGGNLAKLGAEPLVFGPGSIEVAHMADEYVPVADLFRAVDVVEEIVRAVCV